MKASFITLELTPVIPEDLVVFIALTSLYTSFSVKGRIPKSVKLEVL